MSTILLTPGTLPKNLQPFLLGAADSTAPGGLKEHIETAFKSNSLQHITDRRALNAGNWILKLAKTESCGLSLQERQRLLIDRVTQIEELRSLVKNALLQNAFSLPQKYLYWHTTEKQFYIVAERLKSNGKAVVEKTLTGETKANGEITDVQACFLARMSFLGYPDLVQASFFGHDGKIAIIDSESITKQSYNDIKASWVNFLDAGALLVREGLIGTAELKTYYPAPELLKEIEKVEKKNVLLYTAKTITKIFLAVIAFQVTARFAIPFTSVAIVALKTAAQFVLIIKTLALVMEMIYIHYSWFFQASPQEQKREITL
jgi:hypothetical protein